MDSIFLTVLTPFLAGRMPSNPDPAPSSCLSQSPDASRALIFALLILIVVQSRAERQCGEPSPPECIDDCGGKQWFAAANAASGMVTCRLNQTLPCAQLDCPPGFRPDPNCDVAVVSHASCVRVCLLGEFLNGSRCLRCRYCDNTDGDVPCTATNDRKCGRCRKGYFHEPDTPDLCHPCTLHWQAELEPQCRTSEGTTAPPDEVATVKRDFPAPVGTPPTNLSTDAYRRTSEHEDEALTTSATRDVAEQMASSPEYEFNFEDDPSSQHAESDQEQEVEVHSGASSSPILIVCLVILILLILLIGGWIIWVRLERRSRKQLQRTQTQPIRTDNNRGSAEDPENGDGTVDIDWQNGSVGYQRTATRASREELIHDCLLGSVGVREGDNISFLSEEACLLESEPLGPGVPTDDTPASLRSVDETTSLVGNADRAAAGDREQRRARREAPSQSRCEDPDADQEVQALAGSEPARKSAAAPEPAADCTPTESPASSFETNINIVCKGDRNSIKVINECPFHRNFSFSSSETAPVIQGGVHTAD